MKEFRLFRSISIVVLLILLTQISYCSDRDAANCLRAISFDERDLPVYLNEKGFSRKFLTSRYLELSEIERRVFRERICPSNGIKPKTRRNLADRLNISPQAVRLAEARVLEKVDYFNRYLKTPLDMRHLDAENVCKLGYFSQNTRRILEELNLDTVAQLLSATSEGIRLVAGKRSALHTKALREIEKVLSKRNLALRKKDPLSGLTKEQLLVLPVSALGLKRSTENVVCAEARTIGDILSVPEERWFHILGFGLVKQRELTDRLTELGLLPSPAPILKGEDLNRYEASLNMPVREFIDGMHRRFAYGYGGRRRASGVDVKVRNAIRRKRPYLKTVGQILKYSEDDWLSSRNFGVESLSCLKEELARIGLRLANVWHQAGPLLTPQAMRQAPIPPGTSLSQI